MAYELTYYLPGADHGAEAVIDGLTSCLAERDVEAPFVMDSSGEGWVSGDLAPAGSDPILVEAHVGDRVARLWDAKVVHLDVPDLGQVRAMATVVLSGATNPAVAEAVRSHFKNCAGGAEFDDVEGYLNG